MNRLKDIWHDDKLLLWCKYDRIHDELVLCQKNVKTGQKDLVTLREPYVPIYISKKKNKTFLDGMSFDDLEKKYVRQRYKEWNIADVLGMKSFSNMVKEKIINPDSVYLNQNLFGSDVGIEDAVLRDYIHKFSHKVGNAYNIDTPSLNPHVGVFDIESDVNVDLAHSENHPINAVTYIDGNDYEIYTVFLIKKDYKGQENVIRDKDKFISDTNKMINDYFNNLDVDEDNADKKKEKEKLLKSKFNEIIPKFKYIIKEFDDEKEMLIDICRHMFKNKKPDFLVAYNTKYDISQMEKRFDKLGIDPRHAFSYDDNPTEYYFNYKNDNPKVIKRFHDYYTKNYTKILDYYLIYYHIRSATRYAKYSLDATSKREIGVGKLDYSHVANFIGDLPYNDFKLFLQYNIMDNITLLFLIENTNDIKTALYTRFDVSSEWFSEFKSMASVTNRFNTLREFQGECPSNNRNAVLLNMNATQLAIIQKRNPDLYNVAMNLHKANIPKEDRKKDYDMKVEGGLVSSPLNISDHIKDSKGIYKVSPKNFRKFKNGADSDAKEMYPSNIRVGNLSQGTLYGRIISIGGNNAKLAGHELTMAIINQDYTSIGNLMFNLPDTEFILNDAFGITRRKFKKIEFLDTINTKSIIDIPNDDIEFKSLKRFWNNCYSTKYDEKDIEAGCPSISTYFMTDDSNDIKFTYYDTKVELHLIGDNTFNKLLDMSGEGFVAGELHTKDMCISNMNDEYTSIMIPRDDPKLLLMTDSGVLSQNSLEHILNAKSSPCDIKFNSGIHLSILNRVLFYNEKYCSIPRYEIYSLEDENMFLIKFMSNYDDNVISIDITQSIVVYNI